MVHLGFSFVRGRKFPFRWLFPLRRLFSGMGVLLIFIEFLQYRWRERANHFSALKFRATGIVFVILFSRFQPNYLGHETSDIPTEITDFTWIGHDVADGRRRIAARPIDWKLASAVFRRQIEPPWVVL